MGELSPIGRLERMLLATDGSEHSEDAVRVAIEAAARCSSQLDVLTMVISNPEVEIYAPQMVAEGEMRARKVLDEVERQARTASVAIERLVRHGLDPGYQIVRQAEKRKTDLIIMGRRGVRGLARMFVGEATVKVCGQAPCSVLVVPKGGRMPSQRILVASDGSRHADAAAVTAQRLAALCRLPVSIVSVVMPGHSEKRRADAAASVERVTDALRRGGTEADGRVIESPRPETGILEAASASGADLIVTGSHGRSGLIEKVLIGSVAERVLGEANCPVLVARAA